MTRKQLEAMYLEYVNDYLTVAKWAADKGLPIGKAQDVLDAGKYVHEGNHPDK